jgi:putative nucleotidyltransferase-like protein
MRVLLLELMREPRSCIDLTLREWEIVIAQGRSAGLLGSLGLLLQDRGVLKRVPSVVRRHLESVMCIHRKQCEGLDYETQWLRRSMDDIGEKLLLLKGAAYILAGLPAGSGRLVSDIDVLVRKSSLQSVEAVLSKYGWDAGDTDPYNERYYRKWMHEIPPMTHRRRRSVLDVHHTILPPTADEKLDPDKLFDELWEVRPGIYVLSPLDMVLHSATHLFHEGDFAHGLRDLLDLDRLMRHFAAADHGFWEKLVARGREMGMTNSLRYALRYSRMLLGTPSKGAAVDTLVADKAQFPSTVIMDFLFLRAFLPDHPSCALPLTSFARFCLYIRSHYLRMPLYLLLPHLARKAWMGRFGGQASEGDEQLLAEQ